MSESSWFSNFGILSNISTSILQATNKVSNIVRPEPTTTITTDEESKSFTNILTDFSSTVLKSAQQLKQVVEEKSLMNNFTKEHDKFLTEKRIQQRREEAAVPPWVGYKEEEEMKKQILALSQEKRNFLRNPPPGANYHFDMTAVYPIALATLEVDENLKQMRFDLVPKQINEESFWKNYFYRVSLIKQSTQLTALANETDENKSVSNPPRRVSDLPENTSDINHEFVSEDYDTSAINMEDIRRELEQLSVIKKSSDIDESEWDNELENVSAEELEAQINQMLAEDNK